MSDRVLGDLADLTVGHVGPMASEYVDEGVPFLRSLNVRPFRIDLDGVKYIPENFHQKLAKSALKPGDVVVVRTGTPGTAAVVPESLQVSNCSDVVIVRPGPDLDSRYLAYLINSVARGYIDSRTVGAVQQHFNVGAAKGIPIPATSLDEQRRIASVLGALDDLIETNRVLTADLEAQASALFSASAFDREPEDDATLLGALLEVGPKLPRPSGEAPYVDMAALPTDSSRIGSVGRRPATGGARFQNGDTLLARLTPCLENGKAAFVDVLAGDEIAVGSTEFLVFRDRGELGPHWPYVLTRSPRFRDYAILHMNGSSGRQRVSADSITRYPIASPDPVAVERFRGFADQAFSAIAELAEEIDHLTRTRDELLPLLMSGKVRVSEDLAVA